MASQIYTETEIADRQALAWTLGTNALADWHWMLLSGEPVPVPENPYIPEIHRHEPKVHLTDEQKIDKLARFMQRRDARKHGIIADDKLYPSWDDVGPAAQEEYQAEAEMAFRAVRLMENP